MGSQSSHTQGDCFQSLLSEIAEIKRRFKSSLHDSENQVASALRPLLKLTDNTDNSSPAKHVGDNFFQALTCNFEPQNQASERHAVEKFLNKAAFPRKRQSPEHFKNKILRDLFIHSNIAIP